VAVDRLPTAIEARPQYITFLRTAAIARKAWSRFFFTLCRHRPRTVTPIPSSTVIWLTLTPGDWDIATARYARTLLKTSAFVP